MKGRSLVGARGLERSIAALSLVVTFVLFIPGAVGLGSARSTPTCKQPHVVSWLGPVFVRNGRIVGGSTTPVTEGCLP